MKNCRTFSITLAFLIAISGIVWSGGIVFDNTNNDLLPLRGKTAQCDCQICANKTNVRGECGYAPTNDETSSNCISAYCVKIWTYWGECPEKTGGAACPLKPSNPSQYSLKTENRDGAPASCDTTSYNYEIIESGECGPRPSDAKRCVIASSLCGGTVISTSYSGQRSVCDL